MARPASSLPPVTLAILAGGAGRAWVRPSRDSKLRGQPILDYLLDRFDWPGPTLLVTAPGVEHPPGWQRFSAEVTDRIAGEGPLRGVLTALDNCHTDLLIVRNRGHARRAPATIRLAHCDACGSAGPDGNPPRPARWRVGAGRAFPCVLRRESHDDIAAQLATARRSVHSLLSLRGFRQAPVPREWDPAV